MRIITLAALPLAAIAGVADGQVLAGQAVEQTAGIPLRNFLVRLVRSDSAGLTLVDSTRTDERGLFQFAAFGDGAVMLAFGRGAVPLSQGPVDTVTEASVIERRYAVDVIGRAGETPFDTTQVDKQVAVMSGPAPRYPDALRDRGVSGEARLDFVVDSTGRVEQGSVAAASYTHRGFADAATAVIHKMRFLPGEVGGVKVRQRVQMPFVFSIDGPLPPLWPRGIIAVPRRRW